MSLSIAYIQNASPFSGVGQRATHILKRLQAKSDIQISDFLLNGEKGQMLKEGNVIKEIRPLFPPFNIKSINWIRLGSKLNEVLPETDQPRILHATNQTLSFLSHKFSPTLITVHDLIEVLEPQDVRASLLNRYLYKGIKDAEHIIAVSEYTAKTIQEFYGISPEKITVIPNGIDETFRPLVNLDKSSVLAKYNIKTEGPIVLFVGSDHPRKNLPTALTAFAIMKQHYPMAIFVKVGAPGLTSGRQHTLKAIDELNIQKSVRFIDTVSDTELNEIYNVADVFIFPSRFEGFGLPPLQAMAAGLPVVCSNATSLPEVVGDAALLRDADDVDGMAQSMLEILDDESKRSMYVQRGLQRASVFSWDMAAEKELEVYKKLV